MLVEWLRRNALEQKAHPFLRFREKTWTWAEAEAIAESYAAALASAGIAHGDRVLVFSDNRPEVIWTWMACWKLGVAMVPLNTGLRGEGLRSIVEHAEPEAVLIEPAFESAWGASGARLPEIRFRFGPDSDALASWAPIPDLQAPDPAAVCAIIYTSGTTDTPKGVMLSQHSFAVGGRTVAETMADASEDSVLYTSLPLFHVAALQLAICCVLFAGCTLVLRERFEADGFWEDLEREKATIFHCIGFMDNELWRRPVAESERRMPPRICIGGGPRVAWREFEERFNCRFAECYGMTETCGGCIVSGPGVSRPNTCGWETPHASMRVVDGEIRLKAKQPHAFMEGYFKRPDLTAQAFDEDGWYRTGDLGVIEHDGSLRWLGRLGDRIRRKGEMMSAVSIEEVLNQHPDVLDSGVVPVFFEGDEEVGAHVVRRAESSLSEQDLLDYCRGRMAHFMVPRFVRFCDELPKTVTGRTQKFKLRDFQASEFWDRRAAGYRLQP